MKDFWILDEDIPPVVAERIASLLYDAVSAKAEEGDATDLDFHILSLLAGELVDLSRPRVHHH
ncbi:hypothetical protein [Azospirillum argentinense]